MKCPKCKVPGGANNFHICLDLDAPLNLSEGYKRASRAPISKLPGTRSEPKKPDRSRRGIIPNKVN